MTPKEKAEELVDKYILNYCNVDHKFAQQKMPLSLNYAKQCALIAVETHLKPIEVITGEATKIIDPPYIQKTYWQEVKNEIERL